jgi:ferredoxin--NADP+ reductase
MLIKVTEVEHYTENLFRIRATRPASFRYTAGEFTMINMPGDSIKRAYSFTSGPYDDYLEFYSIKVQDGPLTSKLQNIKVQDTLEISERTTGTLTLANLTLNGNLWLMATGTGIAPYISLLRDPEIYEHFHKITVAWTVRVRDELAAYHDFLKSCPIVYYPTVTQDAPGAGVYRGRITEHIDAHGFWADITPTVDRVMICGNMDFNTELKQKLLQLGFAEGSNKTAGTFVQEKAFVG